LEQDPTVTIDGKAADVIDNQEEGSGLNTIVVLAPLTPDPRTVEIVVDTYRSTLRTEVELPGGTTTTEGTVEPTGPTVTDAPTTEPTDRATERATEPATEPTSTATSTQ
jgi:hypothetical protein